MDILNGLKNFLQFIDTNWTVIIVIIGLIISIVSKVRNYLSKSEEEKIEIAKTQIRETMLKLITDAEVDYMEWISAGAVKRSQVIEKIFTMYPVLSKITNQEELIKWIDEVIDDSLKVMREIFEKQIEEESDIESETEIQA